MAVAELLFLIGRQRREVVVQNLLPALSGNRPEAEKTARRLYGHAAVIYREDAAIIKILDEHHPGLDELAHLPGVGRQVIQALGK